MWSDIRKVIGVTKPPVFLFIFPTAYTTLSSFFEGIGIWLLLPLLNVIVHRGDFSFLTNTTIFDWIIDLYPDVRFRHVFLFLLSLVIIASLLQNGFAYASKISSCRLARITEHRLREKCFGIYMKLDKISFDDKKIGNMQDLIIQQIAQACLLFDGFHMFLQAFLLSFVLIVLMMWISWKLTLTALALLPITYFILQIISRKLQRSATQKFQLDQEMSTYLYNILSNSTLVRASARENEEIRAYERLSRRIMNTSQSIFKKMYFLPHYQDLFSTLLVAYLLTFSVFLLLKEQSANFVNFMLFFLILRRLTGYLRTMIQTYGAFPRYVAPMRRILAFFDDSAQRISENGRIPFRRLDDKIEFIDVSFNFAERRVLNKINLVFRRKNTTAIVGPTGAGKTTIINMIPRFYKADSGSILIDGIDVNQYDSASLRKRIAFVDQDTHIFNTTIRKNLVYGLDRTVSDSELDRILRKTLLLDFVMSLPAQYDTIVGDRGVSLSGGEKQRISIARAFLKEADIFLFDEPTSSLDTETEEVIRKAIEELVAQKTAIIIAHRLFTIKRADQIIVIEEGRAIEQGSYSQLIKSNGHFKRCYDLRIFS